MNGRSAWRVALMALLVAACSTSVVATRTPESTPAPSPAPTIVPAATPEPSEDPDQVPPTTATGWWTSGASPGCTPAGAYRLGKDITSLGGCIGTLNPVSPVVTVDVGDDIDVHMTVLADGAMPIYPLPVADDELVARGWLIYDHATMAYRAVSPGTTTLSTTGSCMRRVTAATNAPTDPRVAAGRCPVLTIHVRDITTKCVDVADDLCRAAGAATMLVGWFPANSGRVVGWEVRPASFEIEWPGCGHVFAAVTVTLRDPDEKVSATMGQLDPDSHPLEVENCTY